MTDHKLLNKSVILYFAVVFLGLFIFFTQVHGLMPYDGDDWVNLSKMRAAIPKWHGFNPVKVLPEDLFPIVGYIAAYVVTPLLHDYVLSISYVSSALFSGLITVYVYLFYRILVNRLELPRYQAVSVSFLFLLFHFFIFKGKSGVSQYLFGTVNLTCVFHYLIPALLNLSVVEYFWGNRERYSFQNHSIFLNSLLIFAIYLAIFSNILQSIILAAFAFMSIMVRSYGERISIKHWKDIICKNSFFVSILGVWLVSLLFESSGGRAKGIGHSFLSLPISAAVHNFAHASRQMNFVFLAFAAIILILAIILLARQYKAKSTDKVESPYLKITAICAGSFVITLVYLILVCSKADPNYIARSDVLISIWTWFILLVCILMAYLLKENPKIYLAGPIIMLILLVEAIGNGGSLFESNMGRLSSRTCYAVDQDILQQIITADQEGKTEMVLHVPKGDNRDNWPHPMYMGNNISNTLFRHGIIKKPIKITVQPDTSMNEKYQIPLQK